jgi:DNA-binding transcriptional ArsR family regulator
VPSDAEIHSALLAIHSRLDVIEGKVTVIARAERDKLLVELEQVVKANPIVGRIYLALDGKRNQDQLVKDLHSSKPAISRWLAKMSREHGIVEVAREQAGSKIHRQNNEMEEVLHLSAKIRRWLGEAEKAKAKQAKAAEA